MNRKRIEQVRAMVDRYPEHVRMQSWSEGTLVSDKHVAPECGTAGCIGGWAIANEHGAFNMAQFRLTDDNRPTMAVAGDILELTMEESRRLFYLATTEAEARTQWPLDLSKKYLEAKTGRERADVVIERINLFLDTNGNR